MEKLASSLGSPSASPAQALYDLAKSLHAPTSLRELGMREDDLEQVVELAVLSPCLNPAPLKKEMLLVLLKDAWAGRRPT
jgi:maleylacetate reductase